VKVASKRASLIAASFGVVWLSGCSALLGADFFEGHLRQESEGGADGPSPDAPIDAGCPADRKQCGTSCVARNDPAYGCSSDACDPCASAPNATTTCTAGRCGLTCGSGSPPPCAEPQTVGTGGDHACAMTTAGGVKCWGDNALSQLGDGSTGLGSRVPRDVVLLEGQVRSLAAGNTHTCAVTVAGAVLCWGTNTRGELGDGTKVPSNVAVKVTGLSSGVASVSAGLSFTCALTSGGGVKCWGSNADGQLGNGTLDDSSTPVDVKALSTAVQVTAGGRHACARKANGQVVCWGAGDTNQLGTHDVSSEIPLAIAKLDSVVTSLAAGYEHTCALSGKGVECWGQNAGGQLGGGAASASLEHVVVGPVAGSVAVAAGAEHSCVLTTAGAKCWGVGANGRLGNDANLGSPDPVQVVGLPPGLLSIAAGSTAAHTCVRAATSGIKCWGQNAFGKLGNDALADAWTPVDVVGFP
jgi:alpha-tubulin suppressor-like RCC1 family protein